MKLIIRADYELSKTAKCFHFSTYIIVELFEMFKNVAFFILKRFILNNKSYNLNSLYKGGKCGKIRKGYPVKYLEGKIIESK